MSLVFDTSLYMNGGAGGGVSLDKIIVKSDTIPAAAAKYVGAVYQYVGETNSTYTHGYIYECVESGSSYVWERIDVQPVATRGRFLALWNCATGLAESNPPSSPYPYGTGDYYIVGTVGTTNYKPSGSSYVIGTASTTVETDDVAVNDTYYYDGTNWNLQKNTATTVDQTYDPTSPKAQSGTAVAQALATVSVNVDNTTITKNASNQLQASAVMNARTGTDALPIWQGTQQQWTNGVGMDWYNWQDKTVSRNFTAGTGATADDTTGLFTSSAGQYIYKDSQSMRGTTFDFVFKLKFSGTLSDSLDTNIASFATSASDYSSLNNALRLTSTGLRYNWYYATGAQTSIAVLPYNTPSAIPTDTWFWIKINISSEGTKSYYSADGETWTQQDSSPRRDFYSGDLTFYPYSVFGVNAGSDFTITYSLFDCEADVDGDLYWQPYTITINGQVFTDTLLPTTASTVYSEPNTASALTITSVDTGTITLSDNNTYTYNQSGNQTTYQTIGEAHPTWLCNINGVGVKVGNTLIANNTDTNGLQTTSNLVTSVSSASTDTQYPSAKLLYDTVGNIEATLDAIIAQGSNS